MKPVMDLATQHRAAVRLLRKLNLRTIRLELRDVVYSYVAWNNSMPGNGSMRLKSGWAKVL
jgi:hypothetical protein